MGKKKGKSREQKKKELEEKYNEVFVVDASFEDLVKMSLGIKPQQKKENKGDDNKKS